MVGFLTSTGCTFSQPCVDFQADGKACFLYKQTHYYITATYKVTQKTWPFSRQSWLNNESSMTSVAVLTLNVDCFCSWWLFCLFCIYSIMHGDLLGDCLGSTQAASAVGIKKGNEKKSHFHWYKLPLQTLPNMYRGNVILIIAIIIATILFCCFLFWCRPMSFVLTWKTSNFLCPVNIL